MSKLYRKMTSIDQLQLLCWKATEYVRDVLKEGDDYKPFLNEFMYVRSSTPK